MPKKICIITQAHLCRNPRVLKEALLLAEHQYQVTIIHTTHHKAWTRLDQALIQGTNIQLLGVVKMEQHTIVNFFYRLIRKTGRLLVKHFNLQISLALGYAPWAYLPAALKQHADLYICHQELGLYCGTQLLKKKCRVAFDFEDWYTRDLLPEARKSRPLKLLATLEREALHRGIFCLTTSAIMAWGLSSAYKAPLPQVIYNTFDTEKTHYAIKKTGSPIRLCWFSQTIGPGRGLEEFLQLIRQVQARLEIHLIGQVSDSYKKTLGNLLQASHHLYFHPVVTPQALSGKIAPYDFGLALELSTPESRNYTITNKFFQYMCAGLPVIASNTLGQKELMSRYPMGILIDFTATQKSIKQLQSLFNHPGQIQLLSAEVTKAVTILGWDKEKKKLLRLVDIAVSTTNPKINH